MVRLLAVDVRSAEMGGGDTAPARARPGDTIALTWTFEARGRSAPGWRVFVHVAGPGTSGRIG